ncbi:unnamed protein product [marine sediment metagenome]|uniref:Uncharacterized protein n=1 Tax=marine sediment metagenome TaxID=412755 RepID=X1NRN7_9ZZZZ
MDILPILERHRNETINQLKKHQQDWIGAPPSPNKLRMHLKENLVLHTRQMAELRQIPIDQLPDKLKGSLGVVMASVNERIKDIEKDIHLWGP